MMKVKTRIQLSFKCKILSARNDARVVCVVVVRVLAAAFVIVIIIVAVISVCYCI
jgi:hypothetical protein